MTAERREKAPVHEGNPLIKRIPINASEIIERTVACKQSLDPRLLASMSGTNFSPSRYLEYPPEIVRVIDPTQEEGFRVEVIAGHHRLVAVESFEKLKDTNPDEYQRVLAEHKLESFETIGNDVTDDELRKHPGQEHLTEKQYLELLTSPEKAHESLYSERIPAYIINVWPHMVGADVEAQFKALPAWLRIAMAEITPYTPEKISKYLTAPDPAVPSDQQSRLHKLFVGDTDEKLEQRERVENAYRDIAEVLEDNKVSYPDLLEDAVKFVRENRTVMRDQITGFVCYPEVEAKIVDGAADIAEVEARRGTLQVLIEQRFAALEEHRDIKYFYAGLTDPSIPYRYVVELLQPGTESLTTRFTTIKKHIKNDSIITNYLAERADSEVLQKQYPWLLNLIREEGIPRIAFPLLESVPATVARATSFAESLGDTAKSDVLDTLAQLEESRTVGQVRNTLQKLNTMMRTSVRPDTPPQRPPDRRPVFPTPTQPGRYPQRRTYGPSSVGPSRPADYGTVDRRGTPAAPTPLRPPARPPTSPGRPDTTPSLPAGRASGRADLTVSVRPADTRDTHPPEEKRPEIVTVFERALEIMQKDGPLTVSEVAVLEQVRDKVTSRILKETFTEHAEPPEPPEPTEPAEPPEPPEPPAAPAVVFTAETKTQHPPKPQTITPPGGEHLDAAQLKLRKQLQGYLDREWSIDQIATNLGVGKKTVRSLFESVNLSAPERH